VGEVGSGKSSLLAALLGELELTQGSALLPNQLQQCHQLQRGQQQQQVVATLQSMQQARIGFVSQTPWLMRGTVRDNVLLGQPYNAEVIQVVSESGREGGGSATAGLLEPGLWPAWAREN
jgi:ABC-type multidrug transport system fused ATPase/permease subunit